MPFTRAFLYGLANPVYFLGYSTFNSHVLFFYTDHLHVAADLIGRAWLLCGIWNTANDLLCGWLSDRIPGHRRRTLPILVLSIPVGTAFALIRKSIGGVAGHGTGCRVPAKRVLDTSCCWPIHCMENGSRIWKRKSGPVSPGISVRV